MGGSEGHEGRFEIGKGGEGITVLAELFLPEVDHLRFDKFFCCILCQGRLQKEERMGELVFLTDILDLNEPRF